ncbi:hypothetical protein AAW31_09990 [Nitrosomonas communis]|uniref:Uncharacterized protein n=1 Tax=Nitrosomonas communis TaxID=44574 RepID=A0A0F7KGW4_9PROT|nr:hypothetical protein AAW31_09990 [Nitrosomonas communis]
MYGVLFPLLDQISLASPVLLAGVATNVQLRARAFHEKKANNCDKYEEKGKVLYNIILFIHKFNKKN